MTPPPDQLAARLHGHAARAANGTDLRLAADLYAAATLLQHWEPITCAEHGTIYHAPRCPHCQP